MNGEVKGSNHTVRKIEEIKDVIKSRLKDVRNSIMIMSGKGGVGKSFISASLAISLSMLGKHVGVLDADFHGPDIPKLLGVENERLIAAPAGIFPVIGPLNIRVVSLHFMLPSDDSPVIWRGPMKTNALMQLLMEVIWGPLDYLIVDLPPGTGDEPLNVAQLIPNVKGVILVTIPSKVAELDVKKAIGFARKLNIPVLGIIENMSYFKCPKCGTIHYIFGCGVGRELSEKYGLTLLGEIPLDVNIAKCNNSGKPYLIEKRDSEVAKEFMKIARRIIDMLEGE